MPSQVQQVNYAYPMQSCEKVQAESLHLNAATARTYGQQVQHVASYPL